MNSENGFTLIEITVVMSILLFIIGFGMVMNLNFFKSDLFLAERSVIVTALEKARSRSINNVFETAHGVCYVAPNYVIFRGRSTCLPTNSLDEVIPGNPNITVTFTPAVVVFSQLAGTTTGAVIQITDSLKSDTITINNEGTIIW